MATTSPYHEGVPVKLAEPAVATGEIERRRFGRTGLQMPVFTCGGMRTQRGPHTEGMSPEDVEAECQKNLDDIVKRSLELGINHFETARVYGCSELMYGVTLKKAMSEWGYKREDMIIQTKLTFRTDCVKTFRSGMEDCFERMQMTGDDEYFDLFSFHNLMRDEQLEWITRPGSGLMEVVEEYRAKGKIKWVGFSTHAMTPTAAKACDSGVFDYINVH
jgi:predicted aldo/keto reductase-like oxidoreductase